MKVRKLVAVLVLALAAMFFSLMATGSFVDAALYVIALGVLAALLGGIVWAITELSS